MSNHVTSSVMMAIYSFLAAKSSFQKCMETIIRVGGNICSITCMAGALFGARYGMKCLPPNLVQGLVHHDGIQDVAKALFECRPLPTSPTGSASSTASVPRYRSAYAASSSKVRR